MRYRPLGSSGYEISIVSLGCWAIVGGFNWGPQDEADSLDTIAAALDAGINFFDTAELYGEGRSEQLLAKGLGRRRDGILIASKVADTHLEPTQIVEACERSLKNLATDRIDLYQMHWPSKSVPLDDSIDALLKLKQQGKIRQIGVSNFGAKWLDALGEAAARRIGHHALAGELCVSNQVIYSLLTRSIEFDVQPKCLAAGLGILCYSPLAQGLLAGKFASADDVPVDRARTRHFNKSRPLTRHGEEGCEAETFAAITHVKQIAAEIGAPMADVALAWCLHQPAVSSIIAGARNRKQVEENVRAANLHLADAHLAALAAATDPVKQALGPTSTYGSAGTNRARKRIS